MNNQSPLFSVLIANYNNGRYLQEAVESIKAQSYTNWEIILVDDASTDNSRELYALYADDVRIKIYYNKENNGCGFTKRRCVELATGELCGFLDPDDTLSPDALEVMVSIHFSRPKVALVCSRHLVCDESLNPMWESTPRDKSKLNYLTQRFHTVEVFASFKQELYLNSVGINPYFKRAVDQDLYYLLEEQGEIVFIDNLLYNYRLHSNSISNGHYRALYWHVLAMKSASERRGINPEDIVNKVFTDLFNITELKTEKIQNSSYFKLGYAILFPIQKLIRKCKKILKKIF